MRQQPSNLGIKDAYQLRALWNLNPEQLFDREAEGVLLVHRRDIVEPVEIGERLQIGLVLDQLFGPAMQQSDMRVDTLDNLAVELEHKTKHAVGRGMLGPKVDREVARRGFRHGAPPKRAAETSPTPPKVPWFR